ncbi:hypothetical protein, partial [Staphylococcus aureus]
MEKGEGWGREEKKKKKGKEENGERGGRKGEGERRGKGEKKGGGREEEGGVMMYKITMYLHFIDIYGVYHIIFEYICLFLF